VEPWRRAKLPEAAALALHGELVQLGAVDVRELGLSELTSLQSWGLLRPLEQRRLLRWLPSIAA